MNEYNGKINCGQQNYGIDVEVYDHGLSHGHALVHRVEMRSKFQREGRDFTYVDDIVEGVVRVIDNPPVGAQNNSDTNPIHRFIKELNDLLSGTNNTFTNFKL
ncbi:MAG: hypothetical protein PHU97_11710 [Bacteroidales bacterium]|nr:hypothetical protein [Bacteroidales bacterium]HPE58581.1 hypothetical protein [Bacteroidales bacterium]